MKNLLVLILLCANVCSAQIIIEQRVNSIPINQNFQLMERDYFSKWQAKQYGPQYRNMQEVPQQVIDAYHAPRPIRVINQPVYVQVPTQQNLPGQTEEQRRQLEQLSR